MKNTPEVKLGIVAGSTDWLPTDVAIENRKKLVEVYKSRFEDAIFECSIVLTDNEVSIKRVLREIEKAECNAVCIYWANYGPESAGTLLAQEFCGPVMIVGAAEEGNGPYLRDRRDSLSGIINACYALKLRNTQVYIPSCPCGTYIECSNMIHDFFPIARTLLAIRNLKLIAFGPRPSSYLASNAPNHLIYDLGVEISEYSELELLNSYNKHDGDRRIKDIVTDMEIELGNCAIPEVLPLLAQYELTLEDWIRNHKGSKKYITITSTCWPAFPMSFKFVPCYINSRLTAKGFPVACEVDVYGTLSEYIGQCISNDVVTILNINNNIPSELYERNIKGKEFNGKTYELGDLFLGYHCGATPSCKLCSSTLEHHFVNRQLVGEGYSKGTIQGSIIPSAITLFRIQGTRDNRIRAYVCQGQILPVEEDTYGGRAIIAVPEMERFIRNIVIEKQFPNHCTVVFGHYGLQLIEALKGLGIDEIDYNHPKGVEYRNENAFCISNEWY